jgi:hypothetical protein
MGSNQRHCDVVVDMREAKIGMAAGGAQNFISDLSCSLKIF